MKHLFAVLIAMALSMGTLGYAAEKAARPSTTPAAEQSKAALIDINRASQDELMAMKGIGEVRAKAIIKGRPYTRKDELVQKKIVPQSVYDGIKDQIIAKQK
jgi:DNA uptake protein ComE-like DNA-binding protein